MLDVRKLAMLTALQRLGTVAAVAEELHLTAPGVSMQLAALEKELGLQLTQRQGRRLSLTPAGTVLAAHGSGVLDRISVAELELNALRAGTVGRYTLAAFPSAVRTLVADTCRHLRESDSALQLRITTHEPEQALEAILTGHADLAVIHSYSNVARTLPAGLATRDLGSEPVRLAVPTPLSGKPAAAPVDLGDYANHDWISPPAGLTCHDMVERACGLAGFQPHVTAQSLDYSAQLALVAAGFGVALVPDLAVEHLPEGVTLRAIRSPVRRTLHLAARAPRLTDPGIHTLMATLDQAAAARLTPTRPTRQRPPQGATPDHARDSFGQEIPRTSR